MQSAKKWLEMVLKWSFLKYGSIFNASDVTKVASDIWDQQDPDSIPWSKIGNMYNFQRNFCESFFIGMQDQYKNPEALIYYYY